MSATKVAGSRSARRPRPTSSPRPRPPSPPRPSALGRLRSLLSLVALVFLVVGVPLITLRVQGWPFPRQLPSLQAVRHALGSGAIGDDVIARVIAAGVLLVWLYVAVVAASEIAAIVGRRQRVPRRALNPLSLSVRKLVGSAALLLTLASSVRGGALAAATAPAVLVTDADAPSGNGAHLTSAQRSWEVRPGDRNGHRITPDATVDARRADGETTVVIAQRRDSLFSLAARHLGDGNRRDELVELNHGRMMPDGTIFDEQLRPGWPVLLPADRLVESGATSAAGAASAAGATSPPATVEVGASARRQQSVIVVHGDTLSGLAARHLGDERRWPELWELNRGRRFAHRSFDDPNLILPGWELILPDVAEPSPAPPVVTSTAAASTETTTVTAAATAGARADANSDATTGVVDARPIAVAPTTVVPPAFPPTTAVPSTVAPTVVAAANLLPPLGARSSVPNPLRTAPDDTVESAEQTTTTSVDDHGQARPLRAPIGIAGAALLATGLAGLVASRRRRRLRAMGPGDVLPPSDPDLAAIDAALVLGADPVGLARLDAALRGLAGALAVGGHSAPTVRPLLVCRHASGEIQVWLDAPLTAAPPTPWERGADRSRLYLSADVPLAVVAASARGVPAPCPALVLLGRGSFDDPSAASSDALSEVYVDLEALGVLRVDGGPGAAVPVARAALASLAVSPLADVVSIVATGIDCFGLADEQRVIPVASVAEAVTVAEAFAEGTRRGLVASGASTTFTLRAAAPEEPWEPVVAVIIDHALDGVDAAALGELARHGGVAVVTDAELPGTTWRLRALGSDRWVLEPAGVVVCPHALAADELADIGALLADASAPALPRPDDRDLVAAFRIDDDDDGDDDVGVNVAGALVSAAGDAVNDDHRLDHGDGDVHTPPWQLLVRVLGPVDVVDRGGNPVEFERSKALELVVWLAHHRANPGRMAVRTALWETDVRDATFANVVSDARRAMARLVPPPTGEEWIARSYADRLPVHELVMTDGELLTNALTRARSQGRRGAICTLRRALALVRDLPFAGTTYLWPDGEALPSSLIHATTSAAVEMAERCLAVGDLDGVLWATGQGLRALTGHEELVCLRMRAHAAAGNLAGVRAEFASYERAIVGDTWGDGTVAEKVLRVRAELLGGNPG